MHSARRITNDCSFLGTHAMPRGRRWARRLSFGAVLLLVACAPELKLQRTELAQFGLVRTEPSGIGYLTHVDASDYELWTRFSFVSRGEGTGKLALQTAEVAAASASVAVAEDAGEPPLWDLAFQRFHVLSNGGVSGDAGVSVLALPGQSFEELAVAPSVGYVDDLPDSGDDDAMPDTAFNPPEGDAWYAYDSSDNSLSPNDTTYVVRTPHGDYKLRFLGYYDAAGTSGHPSFQWAKL